MLGALIGGVALGFARRGTLTNLAYVRLVSPWLVWVGLGIQIVAFSPLGAGWPTWSGSVAHIGSYGLLALFAWVNRQAPGLRLFALGMATNVLVIVSNGGYMPISENALRRAGLEDVLAQLQVETVNNSVLMGSGTRVKWLGDVMAVPKGVPLANVFSLGDVLMGLALLILISQSMVTRKVSSRRSTPGKKTSLA